jgi:Cu(I)/Ag(I) efflux system membrane protein CusA/SilA
MTGWSGRAGFIARFGVADDDSAVMLRYLDQTFGRRQPGSVSDIRAMVIEAGLKRIRPCLMTTATTVIGLMPIFLTTGRGSDVMQPMAIPSVGGMAVQLITLFVAPCHYCLVKEWQYKRQSRRLRVRLEDTALSRQRDTQFAATWRATTPSRLQSSQWNRPRQRLAGR